MSNKTHKKYITEADLEKIGVPLGDRKIIINEFGKKHARVPSPKLDRVSCGPTSSSQISSIQKSSPKTELSEHELIIRQTRRGKPRLCHEGYNYTIDSSTTKRIGKVHIFCN